MKDFFEDLYNDDKEEGEPSFTLFEFQKWLSHQKKAKKDDSKKEEMKKKFKDKIKDKMKKRKDQQEDL